VAIFSLGFTSVATAQPASIAPVSSACVARVTTETPSIVGTYDLSGALTGQLVVKRTGKRITFSGTGGVQGLTLATTAAKVNATNEWTFDLHPETSGIANGVVGLAATGAPAERQLVVRRAGSGLDGMLVVNGLAQGEVAFTSHKYALVVYGTYENGMKVFAMQARAYYKEKGYTVRLMPGDWQAVTKELEAAEANGRLYARVVMVSHGGWDGPMFDTPGDEMFQISSQQNPECFRDLVRAVRRGTTADAKLIFSACHSGGSDRFERWSFEHSGDSSCKYSYTDDVARKTGRTAAGPMGPTSTEYTLRLCKAVEGEGPTVQETRISTPSTVKTVPPSCTAASIADRPLRHP
jgi:hypothetical protein